MDEALARRLVERHVAPGSDVTSIRSRPPELVVAAGPLAWSLREVPDIELFFPPDVELVEVRPALYGGPLRQYGFAILRDGPAALHEEEGLRRFLRAHGRTMAPLAFVLAVVRYRLPAVLGEWPVSLVTRDSDLHPASAGRETPLEFAIAHDHVDFTTELRSPTDVGELLVGLDRWTLQYHGDPEPVLAGTELFRATVAGATT